MRKPEFITFTGADDYTPIDGMIELSRQYPIEWGILFSLTKQGRDPRYPSPDTIKRFRERSAPHGESGLRLSAHLCGEHSRKVIRGETPYMEGPLAPYRRFQINSDQPSIIAIAEFQARWKRPCIAQARGEQFPDSTSISWLFDASGGRGLEPMTWPRHPGGDRLVGYAGGIGPDNVLDVIAAIGAEGPYWVDMESRVRTDDRFDLGLCRRVCEAVYGAPA